MTVNEAIKFARDKFGKGITAEEAEKWLAARGGKELTDEELDHVTGAGMMIYGVAVCPECGGRIIRVIGPYSDILKCESCRYQSNFYSRES